MNEPFINQVSLDAAFEEARKIYSSRGFQKRTGFGNKLAIVNVDFANAWTRPGNPFSCDADSAVENTVRLLDAARNSNQEIYICFSTTAFNEQGFEDNGIWVEKVPLESLKNGSELVEIDSRLKVRSNETVFCKKTASCFAGTPLNYQLRSRTIDTVVVTGATASCCVRHTVMDAVALGFKVVVPAETIADRIPGAIQWNLFDMDAKFADVMEVNKVIEYITGLPKHYKS